MINISIVINECKINIRFVVLPNYRIVINVRDAVIPDVIKISVEWNVVPKYRSVINIDIVVFRRMIDVTVTTRCVINIHFGMVTELNRPARGAWVMQFPCPLSNTSCILHARRLQRQIRL